LGKGFAKGLKQRLVEENPQLRRLKNHRIAHDECRDQGGEGFIKRVIEGAHAENHAKRRAANLPDHTLLDNKTGRKPVQILQGINGVPDVVDCPVKLLFGIRQRFSYLPHLEF